MYVSAYTRTKGSQLTVSPDNLRLLKTGVENPIITTAFEKHKDKNIGTWTPAVWTDDHKVVFSTTDGEPHVVAAMRSLLLLISTEVNIKVAEWENLNEEIAKVSCFGVEYI